MLVLGYYVLNWFDESLKLFVSIVTLKKKHHALLPSLCLDGMCFFDLIEVFLFSFLASRCCTKTSSSLAGFVLGWFVLPWFDWYLQTLSGGSWKKHIILSYLACTWILCASLIFWKFFFQYLRSASTSFSLASLVLWFYVIPWFYWTLLLFLAVVSMKESILSCQPCVWMFQTKLGQ